jgi:streptogramin lyase
MVGAISAIFVPGAGAAEPTGKYIVVFKDSVEHPGNLAHAQVNQHDGDMNAFFRTAFHGYAVTLPKNQVDLLRRDPRLRSITADREVTASGVQAATGVRRISGLANKELSLDGIKNRTADVDVAVLDTGIDYTSKALNVAGRVDCTTGTCIENTGTDVYGHGTPIAGIIGGYDNGITPTGIAPGARLWSVKVMSDKGAGATSWIIKGIEWVAAHSSTIEVANLSIEGKGPDVPEATAIDKAVESGIVVVVAAGNENVDANTIIPAYVPSAITVSAVTDYDGLPGEKSGPTGLCPLGWGPDDKSAKYSNWGSAIDVAAPGTCIESILPGEKLGMMIGTSVAAPHVAGAAAIIASRSGKNPANKADVEAIRNTIVANGSSDWTDTSGDGIKEPLLNVSNESVFSLLEPPTNTMLPVISPAIPKQGTVASTTTGTWINGTPTYAYQWQRCNAAGAECVNIAGATKSTYTPVEADVAKTLIAQVTATNTQGSTPALSNATKAVMPLSGQTTEYAANNSGFVAPGPDGNMWYTNEATINKMSTSGSITSYPTPSKESVTSGIVAGPDGNMWFGESRGFSGTGAAHIGKITTSGTVTEYALPNGSEPYTLVAGPDGNIWFTERRSGKIGKITTAGVITEYAISAAASPSGITVGPDGNLWFTEWENKIGKITTAGVMAHYTLPYGSTQVGPLGITTGPDGNLWFAGSLVNAVGRMSTAGTFLGVYSLPAKSEPTSLTKGPDGNVWVANQGTSKIGRVTPAGVITEYPVLAKPRGISSVGPDNYLWFASYYGGKIGKIAP